MKPHQLIFVLFLAIAASLGVLLSMPVPEAASGAAHSQYPSMNTGGSFERHSGRLLFGWMYGAFQIVLFSVLVYVGVPTGRPRRSLILGAGFLYFVTWIGLMISYGQGMTDPPFVLGFPLATTFLVFGMWPISALFAVLYVTEYRHWIFSYEDKERFEAIKARYSSEKEGNDEL